MIGSGLVEPVQQQSDAMESFEEWRISRGREVASMIEGHRNAICERVTERLQAVYPDLCYDPERSDAVSFQQLAYQETPRRFHNLLQVVFLVGSLAIVEREYRWAWKILQRYGIDRRPVLAQVRWYFEAILELVPLTEADRSKIEWLRDAVIREVELVTTATPVAIHTVRGRSSRNGNGHANSH